MKTTKQFVMICCLMVMAATSYGQQWETVLPDSVSISGGFVNEDNTIELVGCSGNDGAYFCSRHSENHSKKSLQQPIHHRNRLYGQALFFRICN